MNWLWHGVAALVGMINHLSTKPLYQRIRADSQNMAGALSIRPSFAKDKVPS